MACIGRGGGSCSFQFQTVSTKRPTEHNFLASILLCHCCHVNRGPDETETERQRCEEKSEVATIMIQTPSLHNNYKPSFGQKKAFYFILFWKYLSSPSALFHRLCSLYQHIKPLSATSSPLKQPASVEQLQGCLVGEPWLISRLCDEVLITFRIHWDWAF